HVSIVFCVNRPRGIILGSVIERSNRCLKVARISQPVGTDGTQLGELEVAIVKLHDVTPNRSVREVHTVLNAAGNDNNLVWPSQDTAKLSLDIHYSVLRDDEKVSIGRVESLACRHRHTGGV